MESNTSRAPQGPPRPAVCRRAPTSVPQTQTKRSAPKRRRRPQRRKRRCDKRPCSGTLEESSASANRVNSQRKRARWNPHHPTPSYTSRLPLPSTFTSPHSHDSSSRGTVHHERATIHCSVTHSLRFKTDVNHESGELSLAQALLNNQGHGGYAGIRVQEAENPGLALQVGVFLPLWGTANPSEVGVHVFCIFCSFEFNRDRQCHGTRKCLHRLSSDKLLRVVVPSQRRTNSCG